MSNERSPFHELSFPPPRQRYEPVRLQQPQRDEGEDDLPEPRSPALNVLLFLATLASVFLAGSLYSGFRPQTLRDAMQVVEHGWTFAVPLLGILLCHEFGHYIAARLHRVDASLPFFIPLPAISPLGTLGAVISMRGRIRSRDALLDIGAAGPLAGLAVAIPVLAIGLALSPIDRIGDGPFTQEGQSLLYVALKRIVLGKIPDGYDVQLHPTAFAGWAGLLVTMINLLPWGQLDGGHVAYAYFGPAQDTYAKYFRLGLIGLFVISMARFSLAIGVVRPMPPFDAFMNSAVWLVWYGVVGILRAITGRAAHPPTDPGELSPKRRAIALFTLALFVVLFMPAPWTEYR